MTKLLVALLVAVFATAGVAAQEKSKPTPKAPAAKEDRWDGVIVRQSKADSTLTVRRRGTNNEEKTIIYSAATKWTKLNKPAEMSIFKDGERIIVLGKLDDKGRIMATRIDLRTQ